MRLFDLLYIVSNERDIYVTALIAEIDYYIYIFFFSEALICDIPIVDLCARVLILYLFRFMRACYK